MSTPQTWQPYYLSGQEGYFAYALSAMPSPGDSSTAPAAPTLALAGLAEVAGTVQSYNPVAITAAGSPRTLAQLPGRAEYSVRNTVLLSASDAFKLFLKAMCRQSSDGSFDGHRQQCLPCIDIGGGAVNVCDATGRDTAWVGLAALCQSLDIRFEPGQAPAANFELWPLLIQGGAAFDGYVPPAVNDSVLTTAAGTPYGFQHLYFKIDDGTDITDYSANITGLHIELRNNLRRCGTRRAADAYPLCARQITVGRQQVSLRLGLAAPLPIANGATGLAGTMAASVYDGTNTLTIACSTNFLAAANQLQGGAAAPFNYSAEISAAGLVIS